jgi:hydrogenase expression/formation protein HypC
MCLAVPGKLIDVREMRPDEIAPVGTADFQGSRVEVSLAFTPTARTGDWLLVHAGFALRVLDHQEAAQTWEYLQPEDVEEIPRT